MFPASSQLKLKVNPFSSRLLITSWEDMVAKCPCLGGLPGRAGSTKSSATKSAGVRHDQSLGSQIGGQVLGTQAVEEVVSNFHLW